ncbi:MAG: hypothetical protein COV76_00170 [Candidatus Omnitrophica bacterium CG11_big_fil_rev_8_21_14_0_20_64_10]|nr:MAG: hypothetical protein COV76_00170 [Candidatus Omnitrophica bacterium CG11_big_fil_rev_8_21_14_0_20_64_10]
MNRWIGLLLAGFLTLPGSALALRPSGVQGAAAGLEDALSSATEAYRLLVVDSSGTLRWAVDRLAAERGITPTYTDQPWSEAVVSIGEYDGALVWVGARPGAAVDFMQTVVPAPPGGAGVPPPVAVLYAVPVSDGPSDLAGPLRGLQVAGRIRAFAEVPAGSDSGLQAPISGLLDALTGRPETGTAEALPAAGTIPVSARSPQLPVSPRDLSGGGVGLSGGDRPAFGLPVAATGLEAAPTVEGRLSDLNRQAEENLQAILPQFSAYSPLRVAVVVPTFSRDIPRLQQQQSITAKLNRLERLGAESGGKLSFNLIVVDDGDELGLGPVVYRQQEASIAPGEKQVLFDFVRLADLSAEDRTSRGLPTPAESVKFGALKYGFQQATRSGADIVVMTDSDDNQRLEELPNLLRPIVKNRADGVIGSRFVPGAATKGLLPHNFVEFALYNPQVRSLFPELGAVQDIQSGLKAFRAGVLNQALDQFQSFGLAGDSELLYLVTASGGRLLEVPRSEIETDADLSTVSGTSYADLIRQVAQQRRRNPNAAIRVFPALPVLQGIVLTVRSETLQPVLPQLNGILEQVQTGQLGAGEAVDLSQHEIRSVGDSTDQVSDETAAGLEQGLPVAVATGFESAAVLGQPIGSVQPVVPPAVAAAVNPAAVPDRPAAASAPVIAPAVVAGLESAPIVSRVSGQELAAAVNPAEARFSDGVLPIEGEAVLPSAPATPGPTAALPGAPNLPGGVTVTPSAPDFSVTLPAGLAGPEAAVSTTPAVSTPSVVALPVNASLDETIAFVAGQLQGNRALVIDASALGEVRWVEGLLEDANFQGRIIFFGSDPVAGELARRHPELRAFTPDQVEGLGVELLLFDTAQFLGRLPTFEAIRPEMDRWGVELLYLNPNAGIRAVLETLGVPSSVIDAVDLIRFERELTARAQSV